MKRQNDAGFSLAELLIGVVLTIGLMGVVFGLMNGNQQVFVAQSGTVDMNQNIRTAVDLLTRDIQSAGTGLVVPSGIGTGGCLAAVFYTDGAGTLPDSIMIVNGDSVAPTAQVRKQTGGLSQILVLPPPDVKPTLVTSAPPFTYADFQNNNISKQIYRSAAADPIPGRRYLIYDQTSAMIFTLSADAVRAKDPAVTGVDVIQLQYTSLTNVAAGYATLMGTAIDGNVTPNYNQAVVAVLGGTVAYRLDTATNELQRTDNQLNWYTIARGIIDFQIQYRVISRPVATIEEAVVNRPGVDPFASGPLTARRGIRAIIITITAETPDLNASDRSYRMVTHKVEITPRNLNFSDNNNLSAGL